MDILFMYLSCVPANSLTFVPYTPIVQYNFPYMKTFMRKQPIFHLKRHVASPKVESENGGFEERKKLTLV